MHSLPTSQPLASDREEQPPLQWRVGVAKKEIPTPAPGELQDSLERVHQCAVYPLAAHMTMRRDCKKRDTLGGGSVTGY